MGRPATRAKSALLTMRAMLCSPLRQDRSASALGQWPTWLMKPENIRSFTEH